MSAKVPRRPFVDGEPVKRLSVLSVLSAHGMMALWTFLLLRTVSEGVSHSVVQALGGDGGSMYIRRVNGRAYLAESVRVGGRVVQRHLGPASPDGVILIRLEAHEREVERQEQRQRRAGQAPGRQENDEGGTNV